MPTTVTLLIGSTLEILLQNLERTFCTVITCWSVKLPVNSASLERAEKVKSQTKNIGHDYFLILVLLNIAGSDIKSRIKLNDLETVESELENINQKLIESLK